MKTIDMIANYHTHTWRCNHAYGTEEQYIEKAIASGLKVLGFSDHAPYRFPSGYFARDKMLPLELDEYVNTILRLKDQYRNDIEIHLGLEAEYYPELWNDFLRLIEPFPIEYLLLGQHYVRNEYEGDDFNGKPSADEERLKLYCKQCVDGLKTNHFLYFAHPDLINYCGDQNIYVQEMTSICRFCKEMNIPLEFNLLGLREKRNYPNRIFWEIVAEVGNTIIFGSDAHYPEHVYNYQHIQAATIFLFRCGVKSKQIIKFIDI